MPGTSARNLRLPYTCRMLSRAAASLLTLLLVCAPAPSAAKPAGTLDRLADDLDARLGAALGDRALGELDLGLAVRPLGGTPDRLGQVIGRLMLERIRARKPRSLTLAPGGLDEAGRRAWTTARGLELILEVDVMLGTGHLHLVGMLRECDRHLWRDLITPQRGALNHLHASVRMDAEVRAYQGAVSSGSLRLSAETFPVQVGGGILALASADLDGDGRAELLALQSRTLLVLRYLVRLAMLSDVQSITGRVLSDQIQLEASRSHDRFSFLNNLRKRFAPHLSSD